ncbi:sigma-70 family RNA polymerase sigma factor [Adhaeretor mobilis]|uniref:RNA polymerase principal sigma factor HrdB n=1 Tax=Adhaeretor mobilis TaxID=1930276 RepID=A0A517MPS6_9BACT|nr:sigma-70 family RNA polymerase sigma factor [Adhaeretor mobilis]QDS96874.1 RNA polymerase principal sigma factor HrdB [Adhaeretor mobilis]
MSALTLSPWQNLSGSATAPQATRLEDYDNHRNRALELVQIEIDFIPNQEFELDDDGGEDVVTSTLRQGNDSSQGDVDLPAHLRRLCDCALLTPEQERILFREMNFLKFRASVLRSRIDPDDVEATTMDAIESQLAQAQRIRDHLIKANMRLVISIVKKFVTPQQSFDDLLSEGVVTLMKAVEKFDFDRGFRFSTYAYRSIVRHVYRTVTLAAKEEASFTRDAEEWAFEDADTSSSSLMSDQIWSNLRELLASLLDRLDRRERFIIRSRYALGAHRKARTFQSLADKLGVSKERVRQLESRAVGKLQAFAVESKEDDLFTAAML